MVVMPSMWLFINGEGRFGTFFSRFHFGRGRPRNNNFGCLADMTMGANAALFFAIFYRPHNFADLPSGFVCFGSILFGSKCRPQKFFAQFLQSVVIHEFLRL